MSERLADWIEAVLMLAAAVVFAVLLMAEAARRPDWREHCEAYRERVEAHGGRLECEP